MFQFFETILGYYCTELDTVAALNTFVSTNLLHSLLRKKVQQQFSIEEMTALFGKQLFQIFQQENSSFQQRT